MNTVHVRVSRNPKRIGMHCQSMALRLRKAGQAAEWVESCTELGVFDAALLVQLKLGELQ